MIDNAIPVNFATRSRALWCGDCTKRPATKGAWCDTCNEHRDAARKLAVRTAFRADEARRESARRTVDAFERSLAPSAIERPRRHVAYDIGAAMQARAEGLCPGCGFAEQRCVCGEE